MEPTEFPVRFDGKNYDIKHFLRDHPGGVNTLKKYKGKSIVQAMSAFGHSTSAYHMLNDFKVNDVNLTGKVSENGRIITKEESTRNVEDIAMLEELEGGRRSTSPPEQSTPRATSPLVTTTVATQSKRQAARLDWSQPILSQLDAIAPHYEMWVNSAVYRRCRLFGNPILESMTYTPWYLVPVFWIPIILYLGIRNFLEYVACRESCSEPLHPVQFAGHMLIGVLIWSAVEYTLHRWVFHLDPGSSVKLIKIHFLIHGLHHKMPFDGLRQVFPPIPALVLAGILYFPFWMWIPYPEVKFVGGLMGYLTYDMIHYYVHHGSPRDGSYLYVMKRYHSNHHFVNHDKAFGITSKLWDHVFKTYVRVKKLGFSLQW